MKKTQHFLGLQITKVKSCGTSKSPRNGGDEKVPGNGGNGGENSESGSFLKRKGLQPTSTKI